MFAKKSFLLLSFLLGGLFSLSAAERIVSLSPNLTEMVVFLGAEQELVGRSSACDFPDSIKKLPAVGDFGIPALEPLLALRPTLVVTETLMNEKATAERFKRFGVRIVVMPAAGVNDYLTNLEMLGKLIGREERANEEILRARARIAAWREANAKIPEEKRPATLILTGVNPLVTAGKRSYLTEILELAGARNVAATEDKSYFNCSFEWIVLAQPEVILFPKMGNGTELRELVKTPGWSALPAVKNNRLITEINGDLLYRLGPRLFDGIEELRKRFR